MKTVTAYEFKDLDPEIAETVREEFLNERVEAEIQVLYEDLDGGLITEQDVYDTIGCSKYYAESTPWFVSSSFYEHNQEMVDADLEDTLTSALFTENGTFIGYKDRRDD